MPDQPNILFLMADDCPGQVRNVANDPALAAIRERLSAQLTSELNASADPYQAARSPVGSKP